MAKQTTVTITDDLDGSANAKEVSFSLNGKAAMPEQPPAVFPEPIRQADFEVDALLIRSAEARDARSAVARSLDHPIRSADHPIVRSIERS